MVDQEKSSIQTSKLMPLAQAVQQFVHDGDTVYAAGFTHLIPFAAGHEIIRQGRRNLTLVRATPDLIYDQLIASGCAKKIIFSWAGNPGVGSLRLLRKAVERKEIEIEEYTHFGLVMALTAGASGVPFMPLLSNIGSDLPEANARIKIIDCPFTGKKVSIVPAINPDVAIIHAQRASLSGDIQAWGITGEQKEAAFASKHVIVTVEEIADEETVRNSPQLTIIPGFKVSSISLVPWGAHPSYAYNYYERDNDFYVEWDGISADRGQVESYLKEWVYGVRDREEYAAKLKPQTRERLQSRREMEPAVG
jgi:glutaconate CoA-transferase subunit A